MFGNSNRITALESRILMLEKRLDHLLTQLGVPQEEFEEATGMDEVRALKDSGQTIQAIKRLRELQPGMGLAAAKDIVDRM